MNDTYKWLYSKYAEPQLEELKESGDAKMNLLMQAHAIPSSQRINCLDLLSDIRFQWGAEVFFLGMQMGMGLTAPCGDAEAV